MIEVFKGLRIGYAMTGSFCTFARSFEQAELLTGMGAQLIPIMSDASAALRKTSAALARSPAGRS